MEPVTLTTAFTPHIVAVAGVALAVVFDAFSRRGASVAVAVAALVAAAVLAGQAVARPGAISADLVVTGAGFSAVTAIIFALAAIVVAGSWRWLTTAQHGGGLAALAVVATVAAAAVAIAADLLLVLICLEAMAVASYALVWSARTDAATEAALKYFVQGAVATGLFVLGLALLFGLYGGSTSYVWLRAGLGDSAGSPVTTALVLIAAALAYKLGAFPFHSWALDAFESAPPQASALLAGVPKLAVAVGVMLLFTRAIFALVDPLILLWVFGSLAVASMAFGVFGGLVQRSFTRMLAYSGVAQVGYALVAPATGSQAMTAVAVLLTAYAAAVAAAFLAVGYVRSIRRGWDGTIAGLAGLGRTHPVLGVVMAVSMFSLVGMPLTAGFWGKFLVFGVAVSAGYWWLALIGVIASVVSFGYYGAVLKALYFESATDTGSGRPIEHEDEPERRDLFAITAALIAVMAVLAVGTAPFFTGLRWVMQLLSFA